MMLQPTMQCAHCSAIESLWEFKPVGVENPTISYICTSCLTDTHARPTIKELEQLVFHVSWAINGTEHGVCRVDDWYASQRYVRDWFAKYGQPVHGQWLFNL